MELSAAGPSVHSSGDAPNPRETGLGQFPGAIYIFERGAGSAWNLVFDWRIQDATSLGLWLGQDVAIDGETAAQSSRAAAFLDAGFRSGYKGLELDRTLGEGA